MRIFSVTFAVLSLAACTASSNGVGTAPLHSPPCPLTIPAAKTPCAYAVPKICCYPAAPNGSPICDGQTVAYCPGGPGASWDVESAHDGGVFADAAPTPSDAGDAAGEGGDGAGADADGGSVDANDAPDANDANSDSDAALANDAPDADLTDAMVPDAALEGSIDALLDGG
ncbi:MAG: hypothetical protein NVS3B20_19830 [Polyangiales bacterium]